MNDEGIRRINELAALAKTRELTPEETAEREALRKQYIADFKAGFRETLKNTSVQYPDGRIVPLEKKP